MGQPDFVGGISGTWLADGSSCSSARQHHEAPTRHADFAAASFVVEAKPTRSLFFEPTRTRTTPVSIAQSPDGKLVVELEENVAGAARTFFLLDAQTYETIGPPDTSGDNQQPSWR